MKPQLGSTLLISTTVFFCSQPGRARFVVRDALQGVHDQATLGSVARMARNGTLTQHMQKIHRADTHN